MGVESGQDEVRHLALLVLVVLGLRSLEMLLEAETTFEVGQRVYVLPTSYDYTPTWVGTVLGYHRNGDWWVQEPRHGSHAAYHVSRLEALEAGS